MGSQLTWDMFLLHLPTRMWNILREQNIATFDALAAVPADWPDGFLSFRNCGRGSLRDLVLTAREHGVTLHPSCEIMFPKGDLTASQRKALAALDRAKAELSIAAQLVTESDTYKPKGHPSAALHLEDFALQVLMMKMQGVSESKIAEALGCSRQRIRTASSVIYTKTLRARKFIAQKLAEA